MPLKKCIATLVIPAGATIVVPNNSMTKIRSNGAFVHNIECELEHDDSKIQLYSLNRCTSWYDNDFEYRVGSHVASDLDTRAHYCTKGIHSFITKEQAQKWDLLL